MARKLWMIALVSLVFNFASYSTVQASSFLDPKPANPATQAASEQASHSVYPVYGATNKGTESIIIGNAVAIGPHVLATTCHVVQSGNTLSIRVKDQNLPAKLLYHYYDSDICLLGVDNANLFAVKLRPSKLVHVGEEVVAISNIQDNLQNMAHGKITNKYDKNTLPTGNLDPILRHICENDNLSVLLTDAQISNDLGGGGLFDQNGNLIGITTAMDSSQANPGFVIPTEFLLKLFPPNNRDGVAQTNTSPDVAVAPPSVKVITVVNNQPTPSKVETPTPTPAPMNTITPTPTTPVTTLGHYGQDNLGVYQSGNECFISISGTDPQNTVKSLAIWFPQEPVEIYIFPQTTQIVDAYQAFKTYDDQDLSLEESDTDLILANETYPLLGDEKMKGNFPILIRKLDVNPTRIFLDSTSFLVQTKDANATTLRFGLNGFSQALQAERVSCERQR